MKSQIPYYMHPESAQKLRDYWATYLQFRRIGYDRAAADELARIHIWGAQ